MYDNQTGAFLRKFSLIQYELHTNNDFKCMVVQGEMLYLTSPYSNIVDEYSWRDGTRLRSFGGEGQRLSFNAPFGIAICGKTMYVSESYGRILIMRLPDDCSEPEVLQVIPSPDGRQLGGLCLNGDRLWCMGPHFGGGASSYVHLSGPCYPV